MQMRRISLLLLLLFPFVSFPQDDLPEKPTSWVTDYAKILSATERNTLDQKLQQLESNTATQIFVAIFPSLPENYALEDFTTRLFEKWRPGLAEENNGVLLTIFISDRKLRIETGYGLEDVLTDAQAGTVINDYIVPFFRQEQYFDGINSGLDVIISATEGKFQIPVRQSRRNATDDGDSEFPFLIIFFFILVIFMILKSRRGTTYSRRGARGYPWIGPTGGGGSWGGSYGGGSSGGGGFSSGFGGFSGGGGASGGW